MATTSTTSRRRAARHDVVVAARDLLDEVGEDGLTMAGVAGRLGLTTMAPYRHVRDRAELVAAAVDLVLEEVAAALPVDGPWTEGVATWMADIRRQLLAHPWVGPQLGTAGAISPAWLRVLARLMRELERSPLGPQARARAMVWISRATMGIVGQEIRAPLPHAAADPDALLELVEDDDRRVLAPVVHDIARITNDELFDDVIRQTQRFLESL